MTRREKECIVMGFGQRLWATVAGAAVAFTVPVTATPAHATADGTVEITVTDTTSRPLTNPTPVLEVVPAADCDTAPTVVPVAESGIGSAVLPAGAYKVRAAWTDTSNPTHQVTYWTSNNVGTSYCDDASVVTVTNGSTTTGLTIQMPAIPPHAVNPTGFTYTEGVSAVVTLPAPANGVTLTGRWRQDRSEFSAWQPLTAGPWTLAATLTPGMNVIIEVRATRAGFTALSETVYSVPFSAIRTPQWRSLTLTSSSEAVVTFTRPNAANNYWGRYRVAGQSWTMWQFLPSDTWTLSALPADTQVTVEVQSRSEGVEPVVISRTFTTSPAVDVTPPDTRPGRVGSVRDARIARNRASRTVIKWRPPAGVTVPVSYAWRVKTRHGTWQPWVNTVKVRTAVRVTPGKRYVVKIQARTATSRSKAVTVRWRAKRAAATR